MNRETRYSLFVKIQHETLPKYRKIKKQVTKNMFKLDIEMVIVGTKYNFFEQ